MPQGLRGNKNEMENLNGQLFDRGFQINLNGEATVAAFHRSKVSNCANLFSSVSGGISAEQEWWAKLNQTQSRLGYSST